MPSPVKCGYRDIWEYATDIEVNLLDQSVPFKSSTWNYRAPSLLYPDTFWPNSEFLLVSKLAKQYTMTVQNFDAITQQTIAWRNPLQVKISLGSFEPFYYKLNLNILGECTNLISVVNSYAYRNSALASQKHEFVLNRPESERKIDLTPYFRDVKDAIAMAGAQSCGDLEYIIENASNFDFVEVVGNELQVYCGWYTKQTGTFDVNIKARLKWFETETSDPVSFKITLGESCNKQAPIQGIEADNSDRVFTYGQIVLVLFLFILSTLLGALIAYLLVSPVRVTGCTRVATT